MAQQEHNSGKPFKNIETVLKYVSKVDEGGELVELARQKHCIFEYDDKGQVIPPSAVALKTLFYDSNNIRMQPVIFLNPFYPLQMQVSYAAHELHHLWEDMQIKPLSNLSHADGNPKMMLGLGIQRILEGATHVFHVRFADKAPEATGLQIPQMGDAKKSSLELFDEFQRRVSTKTVYDEHLVSEYQRIIEHLGPEKAATAFNLSSFDAAGDMRSVARDGLRPDSRVYLPHADNRALFLDVLSHVDLAIKAKARQLTP
jgi:hypothetical protein